MITDRTALQHLWGRRVPFPIGGPFTPLEQSRYLQPFLRYLPLSVLGSQPRPFRVTRRHRSRDHSTAQLSGRHVSNRTLTLLKV